MLRTGFAVVCAVWLMGAGSPGARQATALVARLEVLRTQAQVPAVAGATFSSAGQPEVAAVGVRKLGDETPVTTDDLWHIGSVTKSFTSLLMARCVERGDVSWDATLADLVGAARAGKYGPVTLTQLLGHRAGLPANLTPVERGTIAAGGATEPVQRQRLIDRVLSGTPASAPGESFVYSNVGYIIAGAILEAKSGQRWEDLVREEVLTPLGLTSAGQGPPGTVRVLSQPRGHVARPDGTLVPVEPGPLADNQPYLGPAGRLHMTAGDLARWGQVHLQGERGADGIVTSANFKRLHQPETGATYAMGWVVQERGGRRVIWHNGSNTMWYAIVAFDPAADTGVVLMTNGGIGAGPALDAAAMAALR